MNTAHRSPSLQRRILGTTFCMGVLFVSMGVGHGQEAAPSNAPKGVDPGTSDIGATATTPTAAPSEAPKSVVSPDSTDPRAIMLAVEERTRATTTKSRLAIKITDGAGRTRDRALQSWSMEFKQGTRQLMMFESPADVRNTGMLSIDYKDGERDDDQWLYLPSLSKTTRIASGDKSGSFMGTDLSYADMTRADPSQYDYLIKKQSVAVGGDDCWLIEARPKTQRAKDETGYVKSRVWVSKAKMMPLQVKAWIREGKKLKYIKFSDIKMVGGEWFPHKVTARTKKGKKTESTTVLQFFDVVADSAEVTKDLFTQRRLEQGL